MKKLFEKKEKEVKQPKEKKRFTLKKESGEKNPE